LLLCLICAIVAKSSQTLSTYQEVEVLACMKPSSTHVSQLDSRPPLERLRARVAGVVSHLGDWRKRLLAGDQQKEPAAPAPESDGAAEQQTQTAGPGEPARSRSRPQHLAPGTTRPARRTSTAPASQVAPGERPYPPKALRSAPDQLSERADASVVKGQVDPPGQMTMQARADRSEGQSAGPASDRGVEGEPPAEPTPEQAEETRRVLTHKLLRGTRSGMLLTLEPGYVWAQVLEILATRLAESPAFFQRSVLSLDTRRRPLQPQEIEQLQDVLAPYGMTFKEVGSDELNDSRMLPSGALRTPSGETGAALAIRPGDATNTLFTRRTIRSGQRLRYESSVVIMGDVNSGAEVIAGGDVVVWGALRGIVHAGYPHNEAALVCALVLAPVQLRIGALASRPPEGGATPPQTPEVASVKNGQIVVESWNAGRASRR
jgi:septum site-determining protein MinC